MEKRWKLRKRVVKGRIFGVLTCFADLSIYFNTAESSKVERDEGRRDSRGFTEEFRRDFWRLVEISFDKDVRRRSKTVGDELFQSR